MSDWLAVLLFMAFWAACMGFYSLGRAHGRLNELDRPRREYEERERRREQAAEFSAYLGYRLDADAEPRHVVAE